MSNITLYNGDCVRLMERIPNNSVDLILCDLPYKETGNKWDKSFPLDIVCKEFERIVKDSGAIVLTGSFRFGVQLFNLMPHLYKYDWVWEKENGTNAPNVNYQPFRVHEHVFVFGKGRVTNGTRIPMKYRPQKTQGKPYSQRSGKPSDNWKGGLGQVVTNNASGLRHPKTIQFFCRDKDKYHPTQKPIDLMEFLIKSYTDEGDLVLDATMGCGSTGCAAVRCNRDFMGAELMSGYFTTAKARIDGMLNYYGNREEYSVIEGELPRPDEGAS